MTAQDILTEIQDKINYHYSAEPIPLTKQTLQRWLDTLQLELLKLLQNSPPNRQ